MNSPMLISLILPRGLYQWHLIEMYLLNYTLGKIFLVRKWRVYFFFPQWVNTRQEGGQLVGCLLDLFGLFFS